ncbi:hypothetical protein [Streptomyces tsukubensis]|uniref:Uncharacterized protein n=1 Tax=Streptomyces tsukubensis TaxID=83656 RepID=A0A1V3ZZD9_9ACTN|nr:hypothetical protein [Streptomyces tsukubensis]OON71833.1 hypothetical protein B1H18_32190 [Streptomyces tsukubensis]QFR93682.1 hypothetical protein GBW32_12050 [Streptomyces tsukubensis]
MTSQSATPASSASNTPTASTTWIDLDTAPARTLQPHAPHIAPGRAIQLMKFRSEQVQRRLAALRVSGRVPRIALYARTVNGQDPDRSLNAAREFTERMEWRVGREQTFTDCLSLTTAPECRYGWSRIRLRVKGGFVDGVVAVAWAAVSPRPDEYETELNWFTLHSGFIALVHAENVVPK